MVGSLWADGAQVGEEDHLRAHDENDDDDKYGKEELIQLLAKSRVNGSDEFVKDTVHLQNLCQMSHPEDSVSGVPPGQLKVLRHRGRPRCGEVEDQIAEKGGHATGVEQSLYEKLAKVVPLS